MTAPLNSVTISGTPAVGQTLSLAVAPVGATATYKWKRADTQSGSYFDIPGATAETYTITADDAGKYIKVEAAGIGEYSGTVLSAPTSNVTTPITAVSISGNTRVGQTITAATTPAGATKTWKWKRAGSQAGPYSDISGATAQTYTLADADTGKYIKAEAAGTGNYSGVVESPPTAQVTQALTAVTISGTPQVDQALTANPAPASATVTYKWRKSDTQNGQYTDIAGATAKTFVPTAAEQGKYLKVVITGTGSYTGNQTSAATAAVAAKA